MEPAPAQPIRVLLVEDDDVDVEAVRRAFRRCGAPHELHVARNGREALALLRGESEGAALALPYLILLDLNMPLMNGIEFLEALRKDDELRGSVVFVLTTSEAPSDKAAAYSHHVAGYVVKSPGGKELDLVTELLDRYWALVSLPSTSEDS